MIFHLYKSRLKCLFQNKENIFWSYIFPVILSTLFYFAFTNLFTSSDLETINIAYVHAHHVQDIEDENDINTLKDVLGTAKLSNGLPLFNIRYSDLEEANKALEEDEITAYIVSGEEPKVYVKKTGISETIVKSFMDSYKRVAYTIQSILIKNPEALNQGLLDEIGRAHV